MTSTIPTDATAHPAARVLECAAELLRRHESTTIDPIRDLEDAVYSCWRLQIDIPATVYELHKFWLNSITGTADDMLRSRNLPKNRQISSRAIFSCRSLHRYGPGVLLTTDPHTELGTNYKFDWSENNDVQSVIVGDLEENVLCWQINNLKISYDKRRHTVPDPHSWRLWQTIDKWLNSYDDLVPPELSLHPDAGLNYARNLPGFIDALQALLAFDSVTPVAVTPEHGEPTLADPETMKYSLKKRPDLSVLDEPDCPDPKLKPPDPDSPSDSGALRNTGGPPPPTNDE